MTSTCCGNGLWMILVGEKFAPVPLTGVSVKASITNLVAVVQVEQSYVNVESQPIEAVYKFPLNEGSSVWNFSAEVDGRQIQGVVKETVEAKADYEDAIRSGKSAFMMHEKISDVVAVKVGNMAAKSSAIVRITYTTELKMEGEEIRFYLPSTIAPRYIPPKNEASSTDVSSKSKSVAADVLSNINYTEKVPYELKFEAIVSMTTEIQDIRSPTHKISTSNDLAMKRKVTLSETTTSMDQDLVLYIKVDRLHEGSLILEKSAEGNSALMLSILPKFEQKEHKAELIFVIDRSGSMGGAAIKQARKALLLFLHSLPTDSYVNIVGFGSKYHFLFPEGSQKYGDEVLKIAKEYAEDLDSDLGGTEILDPLDAILKLPTVDGYQRQVFVLTDGAVSNRDEVVSLVQKHSTQARVFSLGLGSSASHDLVEGIARAGNGTALFASIEEGLSFKVMEQLRDALHPSWTNIQIEWEGFKKEDLMGTEPMLRQAPEVGMIPPVFSGKHLVVYALLKEGAHIPQMATLIVHSPDKPVHSIKVVLNSVPIDGLLIHRLAAKKLIQGLEDRPNEISKKEIINLACTYGLSSRYTSFIAVDPKKPDITASNGPLMMRSRNVPVQTPKIRTMKPPSAVFHSSSSSVRAKMASSTVSDSASSSRRVMSSESSSSFANDSEESVSIDGESESSDEKPESAPRKTEKKVVKGSSEEEKLMKVVCLQQSNGSFKLDGSFAKLLDSSLKDIIEAGKELKCSDELWSTLVAVSYLTLGLPQLRDMWALVVEKGKHWLGTRRFDGQLNEKAAKFVKTKLKL